MSLKVPGFNAEDSLEPTIPQVLGLESLEHARDREPDFITGTDIAYRSDVYRTPAVGMHKTFTPQIFGLKCLGINIKKWDTCIGLS
jgi:hypothetical protein